MLGAVVGLGCTAALVACSEEETKKAGPSQDAGSDASAEGGGGVAGSGGAAGSAGGSAGSGGSAGGTGGAGGSAGSGGSAGGTGGSAGSGGSAGGTGGSAGSGGGTGGSGGGALVCEPRFDPGAAGAAGTTDGGPNGYKWRDWANQACADCVGTTLGCADFDEFTSSYDRTTRRLTIVLKPGLAELVEATLEHVHWYDEANGGEEYAYLPMQISGNTLTVELPSTIPTSASRLSLITLAVTDACGVSSSIDGPPLASDDSVDPTATQWPIYCEW